MRRKIGMIVSVVLATVAIAAVAADGPVTVTRLTKPEKALKFEVVVPAPLDQVWTAFTTKGGLETWLWKEVRVDPKPGGDWIVVFPGSTGGGTILSLKPKKQIVISALAPEKFPTVRKERTRATFDFATVAPASTKVTLLQTGWKSGDEWDAAYDYLADGNAQLLMQLHQRFASGPLAWPKGPAATRPAGR